MSLDYAKKYQSKIAERFKHGSITNAGAGKEFDFTGAKAIRVYSMDTASLDTYGRGSTRFGTVSDQAYQTQEMICSQEKSFTKHFEALDNSDISIEGTAGKFLKMQIDEVINPALDKYRFSKWVGGAGTLKTMSAAPTSSTIVGDIMDLKSSMMDNLVPDSGLVLYIKNTYYTMLLQHNAVVQLAGNNNYAQSAVEKGVVGMFDNMKVVPVPSSWMPDNIYFIIKSPNATVDPVKLQKYDVIEKAVGFSGPVVQGLLYFDSFVLGTKCVGVGVAGSSAGIKTYTLTIASNKFTITDADATAIYYTDDGTDPRWSTTRQVATSGTAVTTTSGKTYSVWGEKAGRACAVATATDA